MTRERLNHFTEGSLGEDEGFQRAIEDQERMERAFDAGAARAGGRVLGFERGTRIEEDDEDDERGFDGDVDEEARGTEDTEEVQRELESLRGKFDSLMPETKRVRRRFRKYEQGIRRGMIESDMLVAVMTGDARKLVTTGSYEIPNSLEREAIATLGKMEPDEVDEMGHAILDQIKTPVEKEGVEVIAEKIMGDEKLLTRLYNMTEGWKDKYNDDSREYSEEEQRQACIEALEELTRADKNGLEFIVHVKNNRHDYERQVEDETRGKEPEEEWGEKRAEAKEWAEGAMELGKVIYGRQFEYAEAFEEGVIERIEDEKDKARFEAAFGEKPREEKPRERTEESGEESEAEQEAEEWTPVSNLGEISGGEFDGGAEEKPREGEGSKKISKKEKQRQIAQREAEIVESLKDPFMEGIADFGETDKSGKKLEYQENGLVRGLSKMNPNSEMAIHVVDRMTARMGEPCSQKIMAVFKKIELAPSFTYIPEKRELDYHYKFSRPFMLDGDRAVIYYHSYGVRRGESSTVYYDPVVLVEGQKEGEMRAVEGVRLSVHGTEIEPKIKTRRLRRDLNLEEIARSIIDSQEAVDLATEYAQRESFPVDMVKVICRQTGGKDKVAFKNWHKVVE